MKENISIREQEIEKELLKCCLKEIRFILRERKIVFEKSYSFFEKSVPLFREFCVKHFLEKGLIQELLLLVGPLASHILNAKTVPGYIFSQANAQTRYKQQAKNNQEKRREAEAQTMA
ncbi:hypothetical protein KSP40_PGU001585 [Platanthera guangdongensis]|uniref:Uncharacterized protein n=1 Tax=Platanthera guangdongensis TaxID=2320717 RepID=A0ABR2M5Z2_9ASPA